MKEIVLAEHRKSRKIHIRCLWTAWLCDVADVAGRKKAYECNGLEKGKYKLYVDCSAVFWEVPRTNLYVFRYNDDFFRQKNFLPIDSLRSETCKKPIYTRWLFADRTRVGKSRIGPQIVLEICFLVRKRAQYISIYISQNWKTNRNSQFSFKRKFGQK